MTIQQDFLPINGTDYVEFYVGNAKQAAYFYQTAFGFQPLAYAGLETGLKDRTSYVLVQDKIRFVFTSSLIPESEIGAHVMKRGDGVKVVALWVDDATRSWKETTSRGADSYFEPKPRKMKTVKSFCQESILMAIPCMFLWNAKTTMALFFRDM